MKQRAIEVGKYLAIMAFVAFWGVPALRAQVDRGGVAGTIRDASGGVVPGAAVTIVNVGTQQTTRLTSDNSGNFVVTNLPIGRYTVAFEKPGFKRTVHNNVTISVNQTARVDTTLQIGQVTQSVEVSAAPPLVQSESSSLGTIETERRIVDLPLNGRNFIALAYLGPGANTAPPGANVSGGVFEDVRANEGLTVNGLSASQNNFLMDGVDNNEWGLGGVVALPPPDAIQEFRTEENAMSAEFGRGGAAVNIVLKSGTNQLHGDFWEFVRNDKLDARNFFDDTRPAFRRNQFGGSAGGPIIRDKLFIFGDYQGTRIRQGQTYLSTVPTPLERNGDFSEMGTPIYDPYTTDPNTGARALINPSNPFVIPSNRINTVAQNVVNLYPAPNRPGVVNNYLLNPKYTQNEDSTDIKVDFPWRAQDQFFGHYTYDDVRARTPGPLGDIGGSDCCPSNGTNKAQNAAIGWTHTFSPTMLAVVTGAWERYVVEANPLEYGKNLSDQLGIPGANRGDLTTSGLTHFSIAGFTGLGDSLWTPEFAAENMADLSGVLTKMVGKHTLKFGVKYIKMQRNFFQLESSKGWYQFDGAYTQDLTTGNGGNGLADLLLGVPSYNERDALQGRFPTRYWNLDEFVQDDFRATPDLTINLGLRYSIFSPAAGRIGNFDFQRAIVVNDQGAGPNAVSEPHAGVAFDYGDWGPRVGFAWTPFGHKTTVVRSAFGVFYSPQGNIFDDLGLNPPFLDFASHTFAASAIPTASQLVSSGFPSTIVYPDPLDPSGTLRVQGGKRWMPKIMEWNFTLQHQLGQNWVAQIGYVATRGYRLWNHESTDLNSPFTPLDTNFSDATGNMGRPYFNKLPNLGSLRPLDYAQLAMFYNSFQAKLEKRFASGLSLLTAYTYAKNLGTSDGYVSGNIQDPYHAEASRGPVSSDRTQQLSLSYLYDLPVGRGRHYMGNAGTFSNALLGGWEVSGITAIQTGLAITPGLSFDPTNTNSGSPRPDMIGSPRDFSFDTSTQAALGCSQPGKQTLDCFYNQAVFVLPPLAPGQVSAHVFGNTANGVLRGPDLVTFDFSTMKNFKFNERWTLQFRAEMFNIFNHPNFANPGTTVDVPGGASISSTIPDNQREIQFALKLIF
ncbi:MAG: carboxypeptidase regulatory-like domain-containing protein [Acidobacteria bacterium]|nr:MAG: carboxypeptidase regulatory-like domain-containing protein [Acidobacteriota bacterium]